MRPTRLMMAAAVVCAATAASAQDAVSIYGHVNTTVEFQKIGSEKFTKQETNGSYIGFTGSHDMGGGLKAGFVLQSLFDSSTGLGEGAGSGLNFANQAELNLSSQQWGTVRLGTFGLPSLFAVADTVSLHNGDWGNSADALYHGVNNINDHDGNTLSWRSPEWSGLTTELSVRFDEKAMNSKRLYDLALSYTASDALSLAATYTRHDRDSQGAVRALYTVGDFTFGAYAQRSSTREQGTRNALRLAAMYTVGANEFHINVGRAGKWSKVADSAATQYTLAYNYNLSPRTKLYAFYTNVNNKAGADYFTEEAGQDFRSVAFGIRHNF